MATHAGKAALIFVASVQASAEFFGDTLGFPIDFLHGRPPFYGAVSRDGACLHLKFVHEPVFAIGAHDRDGLIMAFIDVEDVKTLYAKYLAAGVRFEQKLKKQFGVFLIAGAPLRVFGSGRSSRHRTL